jgi:hypothetical protein
VDGLLLAQDVFHKHRNRCRDGGVRGRFQNVVQVIGLWAFNAIEVVNPDG